ncbi:MAG: DNA-deoxyinosine glycosylase [Pseudomonadota bacterium]
MTTAGSLSRGFAPICGPKPAVLILGSLPGDASIAAQRYYAHPRNAFWPIISATLGFSADAGYDERCRRLIAAGVALWDVLGAAERPGSLDSAIRAASVQPNPLAQWLSRRPTIAAVLLNGGKAAALFERHIVRGATQRYAIERLPSTSPAYAAMTVADKSSEWQDALVRYLPALAR